MKYAGNRGKKVLLIGHLDTVFEPDDAFQTFTRDGSRATGPGIEDMKSGDVIIIYALKALRHAGVLDGSQIMVAFTGDEESTGKPLSISRKDLIEAGQWADVALGFEAGIDSDGKEWATIARRSASNWCLEVTGKQAHSAGVFNDRTGAGAIFEASRILNSFYEEVRGEELDRARDAMRAVVERNLPVTEASISFIDSYPAMAPTGGNQKLSEMLSQINQDLGREPMPILDAASQPPGIAIPRMMSRFET